MDLPCLHPGQVINSFNLPLTPSFRLFADSEIAMNLQALLVSTRIWMLVGLVLIGLTILSATSLYKLHATLLQDRKETIRSQVETAHALLAYFHARQTSGEMSREAAQEAAKQAVKALRYGGKEYFWINDLGKPVPTMIMHPTVPALDGKLLDAAKFNCATTLQAGLDGEIEHMDGKMNLFTAFVSVADRSGRGYVSYDWPKPKAGGGTTEELYPKLSFVMKFDGWGWVIGSGLYIDDLDQAFRSQAMLLGGVSLACLVLFSLLGSRIGDSVLRQLGGEPVEAMDLMRRVASGDLGPAARAFNADSLLNALETMKSELRQVVNDIKRVVEAAVSGDFGKQVELGRKQGFGLEIGQSLNKLNADLLRQIGGNPAEAMQVASRIATGDLSVRVQVSPGDRDSILAAMAHMSDSLNEVINAVHEMVNAAVAGNFSQEMDCRDKQGFSKELCESLNQLFDVTENGLKDVIRVNEAIARGDLSETIDKSYPGLFGQLATATNATAERLNEVIRLIHESTQTITSAAREIAAGNLDISNRTERSASSLQETAASMEQLNTTVQQNAEHANQATSLASNANVVATKGGEMVKQVVVTMNDIQASSRKIADIVGVIDSIAFQTNILALNAAVEAARAGEQGRGFAVVASEVRNLAQRSATASKEIRGLINESVSRVENGAALVHQSGSTMDEVIVSFHKVAELVDKIAGSSHEQSDGIKLVTKAVTHMDEVTQRNAALVEQAAAAAKSLEEQADRLMDAVSQFRIAEHQAPKALINMLGK